MDISYRRTSQTLVERAFARLVRYWPVPNGDSLRLDLAHGVDLNLWRR